MKAILKSVILTIREIGLRVISPFLAPGKCEFSADQVQRILVIRIDGIGDLILTIPAIRALRHRFPSAHITAMTTKTTEDILRGATYVDEVIVYRKGMDLEALNFDLVIDFMDDYALKTALIAYSTKAKYRVGFDNKGRGVFFNLKVLKPDIDGHYMGIMLGLVASIGAKTEDYSRCFNISSSEQDRARQFLRECNINEGDEIICIHSGGKHWTARWPLEYFAQLVDLLIQKRSSKIILIGAGYDQALIDQIKAKAQEKVLSFTGRSLQSVAALIEQSNILVCNNSGLLHMACALKTPTVSTMGPTLSQKWWPVGPGNTVLRQNIPCIGCGKGYCKIKTHDCMRKITVEDMANAVRHQLED